VLTGRVAGAAAADGFRRLLADLAHRVVVAVLSLPGAHGGSDQAPDAGVVAVGIVVGMAVLGTDPLSVVLGAPQVTVDWFVVHREHRRDGVGVALLAAAAAHAGQVGAVVTAVGAQEAERQRFLARMGLRPAHHPTHRVPGRTRPAAVGLATGLAVRAGTSSPRVAAPYRAGVPGMLSGSLGSGG
jgi:GNAT superfamily N-acetyltransferase